MRGVALKLLKTGYGNKSPQRILEQEEALKSLIARTAARIGLRLKSVKGNKENMIAAIAMLNQAQIIADTIPKEARRLMTVARELSRKKT